MYDGPIIDAHTHVFPDEAYKQTFSGHHSLELDPCEGYLDDALSYMRTARISALNMLLYHSSGWRFDTRAREFALAVPAANRWTGKSPPLSESEPRRRVRAILAEVVQEVIDYNEWGVSMHAQHPEITCFIGLNPALMTPRQLLTELEDKHRRGARGVKLIPWDCLLTSDDPRMFPIYDYCQAQGLPILFGTPGYSYYNPLPMVYGSWSQVGNALRRFPRLKLIAAHLGFSVVWGDPSGYHQLLELTRRYPYVYGDLANTCTAIVRGRSTPEALVAQIHEVGADRVIFGTNYGVHGDAESPAKDVEAFRALPLDQGEFDLIASQNFAELTRR